MPLVSTKRTLDSLCTTVAAKFSRNVDRLVGEHLEDL